MSHRSISRTVRLAGITRTGSVCGLALALLLVAFPVRADLAKWDQARVTSIAQQLAKACDAWRLAVREQPGMAEVGSGYAQEGFDVVHESEGLVEQSQTFADHLAKGDGHDKTLDMYRNMKEMVDDTEEYAERAGLDDPTMNTWAKVADLMRQIAPYYDPKADTDPTIKK